MVENARNHPDKCRTVSCYLNKWRDAEHCIFHMEKLRGWQGNDPSYQSELLEYINSLGQNPVLPKGKTRHSDELYIVNVELSGEVLELIKNRIERHIKFVECDFKTQTLFIDSVFHNWVSFEYCTLDKNQGQVTHLFLRCEFKRGITFETRTKIVRFDVCRISGSTIVRFYPDIIEAKPNPDSACVFHSCSFEPNRDITYLQVNNELHINTGGCKTHIRIDNTMHGGEDLIIYGTKFTEHAEVVASSGKKLELTNLRISRDFLIEGEDLDKTVPNIILNGNKCFSGASIRFNKLSLEHYDWKQSDYIFDNAVMEDVRYGPPTKRNYYNHYPSLKQTIERHSDCKKTLRKLDMSLGNLQSFCDGRSDYVGGNYFHSARMRTKWKRYIRHDSKGRLLPIITSWHSLYCAISDFGQSIARPLAWICGITITSWIAYALIVIHPENQEAYDYSDLGSRIWYGLEFALRRFAFWFKSDGLTTLVPYHWFGWVVAFLQTSITLVAGTFFILALRRRFKR